MGKAIRQKKSELTGEGREEKNQSRPLQWWILGVLCMTAFLAYARTLSFDFVFDDEIQVLRNPWIRDWSKVLNFFSTDVWRFYNATLTNYYRPLHMVAHAIGYSISGLNPSGFHLINILLHCANTLLLALFGYRLTGSRLASIAGGFLFALHPIHVESVAWIAGITDPLCAVFYFGALYAYLNRDPAKTWKTGLITSLLFLGALFSKEMALTLPLMIVLLDICLGRKLRWGTYAMLAASFGVYAIFRSNALGQFQLATSMLSFSDRILYGTVLLGQYVAKAFIPFDINASHVFYPITTILDTRFILSLLVILTLISAAWIFRKDRKILFLCGYLPLVLIPVLNISSIGAFFYCDRYLYLPTLGSCLLIPMLVTRFGEWRAVQFNPLRSQMTLGFLAAVSLVFAIILWNNLFVWRDNFTFYSETLKRSPDSQVMASGLAGYYFEKEENEKARYWVLRAMENYERTIFKNDEVLANDYVRLSSLLLKEGKADEAIVYLDKAYSQQPRNPFVLQSLGTVFAMKKDYDQAREWFKAAVEVNPQNELSYNNLAFISLEVNEIDSAIQYALKALEIRPQCGEAHLNLARGYAAKGLIEQARESYQNAKLYSPTLESAVNSELQALPSGGNSR